MDLNDQVKRWWKHVYQDGSGCWLWTGTKNSAGYGRGEWWTPLGNISYAHRYAFWIRNGYLPEAPNRQVAHRCHTRNCVNPDHLEDQDRSANIQDRSSGYSLYCKMDHELFADNLYLTPKGVRVCRTCNRIRQAEHLERYKTKHGFDKVR